MTLDEMIDFALTAMEKIRAFDSFDVFCFRDGYGRKKSLGVRCILRWERSWSHREKVVDLWFSGNGTTKSKVMQDFAGFGVTLSPKIFDRRKK